MNMNRRSLITGLISLVAAPSIVRASSIMPVKQVILPVVTRIVVPTDYVIVAITTMLDPGIERVVTVRHPHGSFEYGVRVHPMAGEIRLGDRLMIDVRTGEAT